MSPPGPVTRTSMPATVSPKWSPMLFTDSRKLGSPGVPPRLAKISAPFPSSEYSTRALLMGSAPLASQVSPASIVCFCSAVSGAVELNTTMTGVPSASGKEACCSASARLLSRDAGSDFDASFVVTLWILGPMASAPATSTHTAMTSQGCHLRVDQVITLRIRPLPSPRDPVRGRRDIYRLSPHRVRRHERLATSL